MKNNVMWLCALVLISLFACKQNNENINKFENKAISVKIEEVKAVKGNSILNYSGTIEPEQTIPLSFQSAGTVQSVLVEEGDFVVKGQKLAVLDKADNQSMYDAALAKYEQAKDAYTRMKTLYEKGSLPEIKWIEMETNMKQAESQLQISKSSLEKCVLYSPESGMVGKRNVEPGQTALSTVTPFELVKIENILVKVSVPETEISRIKKGMKATFSISALGDKSFSGEITNVGVVANRFSRTYDVKIKVQNSGNEIKPGMVCDVQIDTKISGEIILVAKNAVSKDDEGKSYVFVVNDDKKSVKKCEVRTGNYRENGIEILQGLTSNELIVVEGKEKLSDNSQISL